jgi:hypothetical protein
LHVSARASHGVIIPPIVCQDKNVELAAPLMRFTSVPFGWGPAAYLTLRMFPRALELVKGNPQDVIFFVPPTHPGVCFSNHGYPGLIPTSSIMQAATWK